MYSRPWTSEEIEKLKCLRDGFGSMKELATLLPGRTPTACICKATKLGLGARSHKQYATRYSWVENLVSEQLKKTPGKTMRELVELTGASYPGVNAAITKWRANYHICGWTRFRSNQRWTPKWAFGSGEDVPKPRRLTDRESKGKRKDMKALKRCAGNPFAVLMVQVLREAA